MSVKKHKDITLESLGLSKEDMETFVRGSQFIAGAPDDIGETTSNDTKSGGKLSDLKPEKENE